MAADSLNVYVAALSNMISKYTTPETYFNLPKDSLYLTLEQENQIMQSINNANNLFDLIIFIVFLSINGYFVLYGNITLTIYLLFQILL